MTTPEPAVPAVTPLQGTTTVDQQFRQGPVRLSYVAANSIATEIAATVKTRLQQRQPVVIVNTSVLADFANLQATHLGLSGLQREYETIHQLAIRATPDQKRSAVGRVRESTGPSLESITAIAGAVGAFGSLLSSALGVASLFRQDVDYKGVETNVDPLALEIAVAAALKNVANVAVYVPDLIVAPALSATDGSLATSLRNTEFAKFTAWNAAAPLIGELASVETQLDEATKAKDQARVAALTAMVAQLRRDLDPIALPLERADQRYSELQSQWGRIEEGRSQSLLSRMLRAEAIHTKQPAYLHCAVVSSGGHHRVTRSLMRSIFGGSGLTFTGTAVVRWALLAPDGAIECGGIEQAQDTEWA